MVDNDESAGWKLQKMPRQLLEQYVYMHIYQCNTCICSTLRGCTKDAAHAIIYM